ncbi:hypothetical protein NsoK4_06515 [Nitrosopumilus sp. K4]|uniref:hypothetical protein n=1 Tax=Nitrosopumilus sp. K4 TaxID=2795383 RepID=UPI001BA4B654|nr:hypothetical protein [Nitrosopumilus sp. K4]QUC64097.1 hypothetical protein NsoK4_06515 [Nitrosopumilus sp. K4]
MLAKSLVIFIGVGILSGFFYGIYLIDIKDPNQLEYEIGPSLSVLTEKSDYKKGEQIKIRIVNSGTVPLIFSDASYGLRVTGLSGMLMYSPTSTQVISTLEPYEEVEFVWDQIKNDGDAALEGLYKIHAGGIDDQGSKIERSIPINIWK